MTNSQQQLVALRIFFFHITDKDWKSIRVYIFHLRFVIDGELAGHVTWRGESTSNWNNAQSFHTLKEVWAFCARNNFKLTYMWLRWKQPVYSFFGKRGK